MATVAILPCKAASWHWNCTWHGAAHYLFVAVLGRKRTHIHTNISYDSTDGNSLRPQCRFYHLVWSSSRLSNNKTLGQSSRIHDFRQIERDALTSCWMYCCCCCWNRASCAWRSACEASALALTLLLLAVSESVKINLVSVLVLVVSSMLLLLEYDVMCTTLRRVIIAWRLCEQSYKK